MHRSILIALIAGCGGNTKDSALPVDSGITFADDSAGDDDGGSTDDSSDDGGSTDDSTDGGTDDASDDGGTDDSTDGGSDDASDDGGESTGGTDGADEDDCTDAPTDIWEPNNEEGDAEPWGDVDGTEFDIAASYLYPADDVDRFSFEVTDGIIDGWDVVFDIQVKVTDVPTDVDIKLQLWHTLSSDGEPGAGMVGESNEAGPGGEEEVTIGGLVEEVLEFFADAGGTYQIVVMSDGAKGDCRNPYTINVSADTK